MRALALAALALGTAAGAQDVRIVPEVGEPATPSALVPRDCGHGANMAVPLSPDVTPVPMPGLALDGPEPVPMPNVCAEDIDLTAEADMDGFLNRPRALRRPNPLQFRRELRTNPSLRERLRQFRGLDAPSDLLALPPVAPPDDRP